jgi:regulator of protease activity HflC (stomatin/prohibitin superfamily)
MHPTNSDSSFFAESRVMKVVLALLVLLIVLVVIALSLSLSVRVVTQHERGVLFRLGPVTGVKEPGLTLIIPAVDPKPTSPTRAFRRSSTSPSWSGALG